MTEGTEFGKTVCAEDAIAMLHDDVLGRNAAAKRFLMDVEAANRPAEISWVGTITLSAKRITWRDWPSYLPQGSAT
jgi:hypothetical protein